MREVKYSLCPNCDACPEVLITDDAVLIGEKGNQVRLSPQEWNVLVAGVKSGALAEAPAGPDGCDCC